MPQEVGVRCRAVDAGGVTGFLQASELVIGIADGVQCPCAVFDEKLLEAQFVAAGLRAVFGAAADFEQVRAISRWREICETIHSLLVQQFRIQRNHARSFAGLCARLIAKLTAHTLLLYLNRLPGNPDFLKITLLAFLN